MSEENHPGHRLVSYKLISGYTVDNLEQKVNYFLSQPENYYFACVGVPQMFGHSEFIQALQGYK